MDELIVLAKEHGENSIQIPLNDTRIGFEYQADYLKKRNISDYIKNSKNYPEEVIQSSSKTRGTLFCSLSKLSEESVHFVKNSLTEQ